jgi:D-serine deaminase-like pyridoxal phosphate-dependent protein
VSRWAWAEIDHDAIRHNVEVLRRAVAPSAVWAVVKADGYGHGSIDVARSALAAGAEGLCVALVDEGVELRRAGIDAPILLLSEQPLDDVARIVEHRLIPTVYTRPYIDALAALDADGIDVHLKIDTGMGRVGVDPGDALELAEIIVQHGPRLRLAGVATHLASADEITDPATASQLALFASVLATLPSTPLVHAANSAGALAHPVGDFAISHYARLAVASDRIKVRYVIDMAEIPTFQEIQRISSQGISPSSTAHPDGPTSWRRSMSRVSRAVMAAPTHRCSVTATRALAWCEKSTNRCVRSSYHRVED